MKKTLRIIVSSTGSSMRNQIIQKIFAGFSISHCTIVHNNNAFHLKNCRDAQWLNFNEIIYGKYPTQWKSCIPIDAPLLKKLSYCETIALQMMNRLDWDETISYITRKEMYLNHIRFWNNELITKKITLCIFFSVPHEIYDFILYSLCKIYSIPVICLTSQRFKDTTLITNDYEKLSPELLHRYNQLAISMKNYSTYKIKKQISPKFIKKITSFSFLSNVSVIAVRKWRLYEILAYLKDVIKAIETNPNKIIRRLFNPLFLLQRLKSVFRKQMLKIYYWKLSKKPDFTKKFIYIPLHYQPECTTSPSAGIFVNQELIVHLLHQTLPDNVYLYVKEHPMPSYTMRSFAFYNSLLVSPRVVLIKKSIKSKQLIKHSIAVATVTGTAGWEALLQKKPVLMFGYDFYQFAPGVFQITSIQSCKEAIGKIVEHKFIFPLQKLHIFYKAMEDTFINGYIDEFYTKLSNLTYKKNIQNISTALTKAINRS